jgi:hypothetical protein
MDARKPRDEIGRFADELRAFRRRLDDLEAPSGSAINRTSSKVGALNVQGQIDALAEHFEMDIWLEADARQAADQKEVQDRNNAIAVALSGATAGKVVLTSPDGTKWQLGVSDAGTTTWTEIP